MSTAAQGLSNDTALTRLEPQGHAIQLADLLRWRLAAKHLPLENRQKSTVQSGVRRSVLRGRGIDFDEVRPYQAGDDVRTIDWRVTARTGKPHTKLFREEKERPVLLVIDMRSTMFFGSRRCFKSVMVAHAAALLAWAALDAGDRIGALVVHDEGIVDIKPRRSRHTVLQLFRQLTSLEAQHQSRSRDVLRLDPPRWQDALQQLAAIGRPGACFILLGDFHDWDAGCAGTLHSLTRHSQCLAVQVTDALEIRLPALGMTTLRSSGQRAVIDTADTRLLQAFRQRQEQHQQQLSDSVRTLQIPLLALETATPLFPALHRFLAGGWCHGG